MTDKDKFNFKYKCPVCKRESEFERLIMKVCVTCMAEMEVIENERRI